LCRSPAVHVGLIEDNVGSHVCWPGGQHLLLAVDEVAGVETRQLESMTMRDSIGRARFNAVSAENASVVVDVVNLGVTLSAADAILRRVLGRFDVDAVRGAGGGAQEAGYALLQAVLVALQDVRAAKTRFDARSTQRAFAVGIVLHDRRLKHLHEGDAHALGDGGDVLQDWHSDLVYRKPGTARHTGAANGYSLSVNSIREKGSGSRAGLCDHCRFMRQIKSDRGSSFYLCSLSLTDASFPKYPRLPVLQCRGYEEQVQDEV